jgi:hypothetical protein
MHKLSPNNLEKDIGGQCSDVKVVGESPQVSDHYQYCFRNSPYDNSNQQYQKAGNRIFFLSSEMGRIPKCSGFCPHWHWQRIPFLA